MEERGGGEHGLHAVGIRPHQAVEVEPGQDLEEEGPARGGRAERPQRQAEGVVVAHAGHDALKELGRVGHRPPGVQALRSCLQQARAGEGGRGQMKRKRRAVLVRC